MKALWSNNKTGRFVIVYEKCNLFARMYVLGFNDMQKQGHQQINEPQFSKTYKFHNYLMGNESEG